MQNSLYIGVMSGTSLDGIDIALVDITDDNITFIAGECYPFPNEVKMALWQLCQQSSCTLLQLGELDHRLGQLYADSINNFINKYHLDRQKIGAIGCHGQTIYHSPNGEYPFTMQIGDANIIAAKTGITTVADLRRKDMAYGGQGAPLVPAFHQAIFSAPDKNRIILNIGGISNITVLSPNQPIIGFDTGPGNLLLDSWIMRHLNQPYDKDAQWAKTGIINQSLLQHLLNEPYFHMPYPKSTGRELFNINWLLQKLINYTPAPKDVQATLVELTVNATIQAINKQLTLSDNLPNELLICGGGAKNPLIIERFSKLLEDWSVLTTDQLNIDSSFIEAMAFAWLAYCRIHNLPSNITTVTGATKAISLGVIYPN